VLASATAVSAAGALLFNLMPALLASAAPRFGLTDNQLGVVGSSYLAGFAVVATTSNLWIDRLNWRAAVAVATVLAVLGLAGGALVRSYGELLAALGVAGFGLGVLYTICIAIVSEHHRPDQAFGVKLTGEVLLAVIGLVVLTSGVSTHMGFPGAIGAVATLVGVTALCGLSGLPSGRALVPPEKRFMMKRRAGAAPPLFHNWAPWLGLAALFVSFAGLSSLWAFISQLAPTFGVSGQAADNALAVTFVVSGAAGLAAAFIGDRLGRAKPLAAGMSLAILGAATLALGHGFNAYLIGIVLAGGLWNFPLAYQMGMIASADGRGNVAILMPAALAVGGSLGPLLGGALLAGAHGYMPLYALFGAATAAGLAAFMVLGRKLTWTNRT
jgi:predicted MFS family arabinose efflux permease